MHLSQTLVITEMRYRVIREINSSIKNINKMCKQLGSTVHGNSFYWMLHLGDGPSGSCSIWMMGVAVVLVLQCLVVQKATSSTLRTIMKCNVHYTYCFQTTYFSPNQTLAPRLSLKEITFLLKHCWFFLWHSFEEENKYPNTQISLFRIEVRIIHLWAQDTRFVTVVIPLPAADEKFPAHKSCTSSSSTAWQGLKEKPSTKYQIKVLRIAGTASRQCYTKVLHKFVAWQIIKTNWGVLILRG